MHHFQMSPKRRKRVCLFGTSADPPTGHGGHGGMVAYLASLDEIDQVVVLPVHVHIYATKRRQQQASFDQRMQMCRLAFAHLDKVVVSNAEQQCSLQSQFQTGTVDLIEMFMAQEPNTNTDYCLALGTDTFLDLIAGKWKQSKHVLDLIQGRIYIIPRMQLHSQDHTPLDDKIHALNAKYGPHSAQLIQIPGLTDVSSTYVRGLSDESNLRQYLHSDVANYIIQHKLYGFTEKTK